MHTDTPIKFTELSRAEIEAQQSLDFTKYLSCLAHQNGLAQPAMEMYVSKFPRGYGAGVLKKALADGHFELSTKATVAPGTSTDATWAGPLVNVEGWVNGFLAIAHQQSLVGRLGLQLIPFNAKVPFQTGDAGFAWVPESGMTPVSKAPVSAGLTLGPAKVTGIVVLTQEFVKLATAGTAPALRQALISGLNAFVDGQFINPTVAAVAQKNPASITNGLTPLVGTADVKASVQALVASFFAGSPGSQAPVLIANGGYAAAIRGQVPGFGLEVVASDAVGTNIVMLDPQRVFYADGGLEIAFSREAALQMDSAPDSPPTAATVTVSLYQMNCVGYRLLRFISWGKAPGAVAYSTMP